MAETSGTGAEVKVPGSCTEEGGVKEKLDILHGQLDDSLLPVVEDEPLSKTEVLELSSVPESEGSLGTSSNPAEVCVTMETEKNELSDAKTSVAEQADVSSCKKNDNANADATVAKTNDVQSLTGNVEMAEETQNMDTGDSKPENVTEKSTETLAEAEMTTTNEKDAQSDTAKVGSQELLKEKVGEPSNDSEMKSDGKTQDKPSEAKDDYRHTVEISDSDSEDSDSSSVSSLSSPSSDSDSDCIRLPDPADKGKYSVIKAPGELLPEDLPPIEELHITVLPSLCAEIGAVTSIVQTLVVIQSCKGVPALDLDSVLFLDKGARALGAVFDVFGPVTEPLYCVRFNSAEHIAEFNVKPGDVVYYAPQTEHSKYVFLQQLMKMRGSDASKRDDIERTVQVEFSDDEDEKNAWKEYGGELDDEDPDATKRKRDKNEVTENKKKFAPQFPPRGGQRGGGGGGGGQGRPQGASRGRPAYRRQPQRPNQPRHEGPVHPPNFNFPPPSLPGPSGQRPNTPQHAPQTYSSFPMPQGYNNQPYQATPSFGQLPFAQPQGPPQVDPRVFQFGAQFAQMVCNLQNASSSVPMNVPPPGPSFSAPYNQYSGAQNNFGSFYPPTQNQRFSSPSFTSPPLNMPPMNVPPPRGQAPYPQHSNLPNQTPYGSAYQNYNNGR